MTKFGHEGIITVCNECTPQQRLKLLEIAINYTPTNDFVGVTELIRETQALEQYINSGSGVFPINPKDFKK